LTVAMQSRRRVRVYAFTGTYLFLYILYTCVMSAFVRLTRIYAHIFECNGLSNSRMCVFILYISIAYVYDSILSIAYVYDSIYLLHMYKIYNIHQIYFLPIVDMDMI
jgi:hypothetical protein